MKPLLRLGVSLPLLCALLTISKSECVDSECNSKETETLTTTTTTVSFGSGLNCSFSIGANTSENGVIMGLIPGTVYQTYFDCWNCCTKATTKPEVVINLVVTDVTTDSISLTWTEPHGRSSSYIVRWTAGKDDRAGNTSETSTTITDLTAGAEYNISVTAVADDGLTVGEEAAVSQCSKPEAVRNLSVSEITTSSVSLMWTEPEGKSSFYRVQWTNGTTNWDFSTNETKLNVTGLTAGVQYSIIVIAVAGDNTTGSEKVEIFHYTKPEAVRNLTVYEITTSSVSLMWTEPKGKSSFYRVQWTNGTTNWDFSTTETKLNVTGLTAGVRYSIIVIAVAGDNTTGSEKVESFHYTKPEAVRNLTVNEITTSSVSLMWTEPEGKSSFYRVQWTNGTTNWDFSTNETKLNVTGLTPGVQYNITVIAVAGDNTTGSEKVEIFHYTKPEAVRNLTVGEITTSSMSLNWTETEGKSSFYRVRWTNGNYSATVNVTERRVDISGLTPGVQYEVTVTAVADDGLTEGQSPAVTPFTKPEAVRNLSVSEITTSSVSLMWTEPKGKSSFYRVQWTNGTTNWDFSTNETKLNVTGLTAGVQYSIIVIAVAGDNTTGSEKVEIFHYTKPEAVRNLTVYETTTSSISLMWTEPEGKSSFFRVQWTNGTTNWDFSTNETKLNVTGLTAGVQYNITVIAVAGDNTTGSEKVEILHYTKPEAVRNLSVSEITTSSVSLMWTEPKGKSSFYRVQWTNGTTNWDFSTTEKKLNVTGLTAGVQYSIIVIAVAGDNTTGSEKVEIFHYTKPEAVRNLTVNEITTSSISLMWTEPKGKSSFYRVQWTNGTTNWDFSTTEKKLNVTGLTAGVQYNIIVIAVAGDNTTGSEKVEIFHYTKPEAVRNLTVYEITTSSISLMWTEPEGKSSFYRVQWTNGTTNWDFSTTETKLNVTGLTAGVQYNITVIAVAGDNTTGSEKVEIFQYTKPEAVRNLTVGEITTSSMSLNWTEPEGKSSFYRVRWTNGNYSATVNVTERRVDISGLTPGVQYEVTVTAVADDGLTEGQSPAVTPFTKPEAVRNLSVSEITTSSVSLMWTEPEGKSSFYRVQWTNGTTNWDFSTTETKLNVTGLTAGVQYSIIVIAVAGDNTTGSEKVEIFHYTKPEAVRNLTVNEITTSSVSLMWTEPEGKISFYRVQWTNGTTNWDFSTNETKLNVTGLTAGVQYNITVIAVAGDNTTGSEKVEIFHYTKPEAVRNLTVGEITTSSMSLNWTEPEGKSSFYRVRWTNGNYSATVNVTERRVDISGLTPGVQYEVTVTAVADDGLTEGQSPAVTPFTKPEAVRNISVSEITTSSVSLMWTEPKGKSSFYRVQWTNGTTNWDFSTNETKLNVTGLTAGVQYSIIVIAVAGDNTTGSEKVEILHYTKPEAVRNLTVNEITTSSVSLMWTEPEGKISFYRVQWTNGTTNWDFSTNETKLNVTGLTAGVQYNITVIAVAGDNTTGSEKVEIFHYTKPEAVRNLTVGEITTSSMSLNWTEPEGKSSFYRVRWTNGNYSATVNGTETRVDISDLTPGVQYEVTVTAVADDGLTEGQSPAVTPFTKPEAVRNLSVSEITTSSVSLMWTEPEGKSSFYRVQWTNGTTNWDFSTTETKLNVTGLTAGVQYSITVIAVAGDNTTGSEKVEIFHYTKPEAVRNLTVGEITTSSMSLNWTEPEGKSSFYRVRWTNGNYSATVNVTETRVDISGLTPGVQYEVTVTAVADDGLTEGQSPAVTPFTKPETVRNLTVYETTTSSVSLMWTEPKGKSSFYRVQWTNGTTNWDFSTTETKLNVTGLTAGVQYSITVIAVAGDNTTGSEKVEIFHYTKPEAVRNLTASQITTSSVLLTWTEPDGESSFYRVQGTGAYSNLTRSVSGPYVNISELTAGERYTFAVTTVAGDQESCGETLTLYTRPGAVRGLTVSEITTSSLWLNWIKPTGNSSFYSLQWTGGNFSETVNVTQTRIRITNLTAGVQYEVTVTAVAGDGLTEGQSVSVTPFTRPGKIEEHYVDTNTTSISLSWTPPAGEVFRYTVAWSNGEAPMSRYTYEPLAVLSDLIPGTTYTVTVVANAGDNQTGEPYSFTSVTTPAVVRGLNVTDVTTSSVSLHWTEPEGNAASYTVQWTVGGVTLNGTTSRTSFTVTDLMPGSRYNVTVAAVAANSSKKGEMSSITTFTVPNPPGPITVESQTVRSINFTWPHPEAMDQHQYNFLVSTFNGSFLTEGNWFLLDNLQSGSLYRISVVTVSIWNYTSTAVTAENYTKHERVEPSISSHGSNSSILVTWNKPPGTVEHYKVRLNSSTSTLQEQVTITTNTSWLFENLSAGRLYSAMVTTCNGPVTSSSGFVSNATFPNPPGPTTILTKTTSSIDIKWEEASLMTGASFQYWLTITSPQVGVYIPSTNTSHTFNSLSSGTSYNISVATVGVMGFESEQVQTHKVTTRPFSVKHLRASTEEESITVTWVRPDEHKESYRYNVTWQSSDGDNSIITEETKYHVDGLVPGTPFNLSVTTETSDGTQGAPTQIYNCTDASPVKNLTCEGPNGTNAEVILSWSKPNGQHSFFQVTVNDSNVISMTSSCCNHSVSRLLYHTVYKLTVQTVSCGQPSTPVSSHCRTGITNPPIPNDDMSLVVVSRKEHNKFSLQIHSGLLNDANGPITHVGVLVTQNLPDKTSNWRNYLGNTYDQWKANNTPIYLATVTETISQSRSAENHLSLEVGDESKWKGYTNGALVKSGTYQYAVVLFTSLSLQNDFVNGEMSLVSRTNFYPAVELPKDPAIIGIAVGATMGIFSFFFIILIGFITYWRRLSKKESSDIQIHSLRSVGVRMEDYEAYYRKQKADSNCGFAEEFEDLKVVGTDQLKTNAVIVENKPKNRYSNVLPYDCSRVKLSIIHGSPYDDYINANYIPGYNSRKEFIATQGPLPATVNEFWRMIWEKNVQTLVMLARCNEQGRVKCEQYWDSGTKHFDNITVTTTSEIPLEDWTIRDISIKNVKTAETRSVRQFHFTAWPDHGVPETTELLISFRHLVREHMDQYSRHSPTVVHCSAGVGRTGTFIAIDRLIFQIERENIVDVYGIVHDMRMHRTLMVQTEDQYVFLNQCAMDIIRSRTGTNVDLIYQNITAFSIYENIDPRTRYPKDGNHNT